MFSSRSFVVSGLTFISLIHFEFILVYGVRKCSSFILLQVVDQFSQHHLLKKLSFLHCICLPPLSKIVSIGALIYLWAFSFVPLIYISIFVTVPYNLYDSSIASILKSGRLISPVPFFFLKIALDIRVFFVFPYKL